MGKWFSKEGRTQTEQQQHLERQAARNRDKDKAAKNKHDENRSKGRSIEQKGKGR